MEWTEIRDKLWVYKLTNEPSDVDEPEYRELLKKVDEVGKELAMVESEVDEYFKNRSGVGPS